MDFVEVAIKSAWWSKVNWAQAIAILASAGVFLVSIFLPRSRPRSS